jgi:hypothetical protein
VKSTLLIAYRSFTALLAKAGPYVLLEILLPGGTMFALGLYMYRQSRARRDRQPSFVRAFDRILERIVLTLLPGGIASAWRGRHDGHDGLEALACAPVRGARIASAASKSSTSFNSGESSWNKSQPQVTPKPPRSRRRQPRGSSCPCSI